LKRAIVAQLGLGANVPEDAIYPINLGDESGKPPGRRKQGTPSRLKKVAVSAGQRLLVDHPVTMRRDSRSANNAETALR